MQQKLEEKDESTVEIKETFTSLQQEVDSKTKKLKKVRLFVLANLCFHFLPHKHNKIKPPNIERA